MTRGKSSVSAFTVVYNLVRSTGILELGLFRRLFISSYFLYKKLYEDPFWFLVRQRPQFFLDGDILDIGANVGYTACLFARAASPAAKVYAFEPDRATFETLVGEITRRKLETRIEPLQLAVGSEVGSVEFWHNVEHSADHRVVTPKFKESGVPDEKVSTVASMTVDEFVHSRGLQQLSFVKIDVQGYELAVCAGMRQTLEKFPATPIAIEYSPQGIRELGNDPRDLLLFFRSRGYQIYSLTRSALALAPDDQTIERLSAPAGYIDLLCMKQP